jgi:hypothetical protein
MTDRQWKYYHDCGGGGDMGSSCWSTGYEWGIGRGEGKGHSDGTGGHGVLTSSPSSLHP